MWKGLEKRKGKKGLEEIGKERGHEGEKERVEKRT